MLGFSEASPAARWHDTTPIRVGVSSCLLGERVRWDGGHKRNTFVCERLGPFVEWVPVCPEVELGLPVPRETLRLEAHRDETRLVASKSRRDWSAPMQRYAAERARALREERLCGYLFKAASPSCGLTGVPRFDLARRAAQRGRGLFARAVVIADPQLAVEEETRLGEAPRRERFVERMFAAHRLQSLWAGEWSRAKLMAFHRAHALQLRAHSGAGARRLDALIASKTVGPAELRLRYSAEFCAVLSRPVGLRRHLRVLKEIESALCRTLDRRHAHAIRAAIAGYRDGSVALAPLRARLLDFAVHHGVQTVAGQVYLEPQPKELMGRS